MGDVLSVEVQRLGRGFADLDGPLDWRHNHEFSGLNILNIGSTCESLMRWLGRGTRVMAMTKVHVPWVHMRFSETPGLSQGNQTWIDGTQGTIYIDARQTVFGGKRGDADLKEIPNPPAGRATTRVEIEFINAIRGLEPVVLNTFEIGAHYMAWTEAVHRSAKAGRVVHLPL